MKGICMWLVCGVSLGMINFIRGASSNEGHEPSNPYLAALAKRPWQSDQGYVQVRRGAFLFWWLYYADGTRRGSAGRPLVIWVQGGPGFAATGLANFAELGPLNMKMQPRNHTWVKGRNVLLIDHPVGTGFSYAVNDDATLYATRDRRVALDLMHAIKGFLKVHPEFQRVPSYITSQSYGGKIAPRLGYILHKAIIGGYINMNLRAVGIGSGWVDPREISMVMPSYLYHMGLIDLNAYGQTTELTKRMAMLITQMHLKNASNVDMQIYGTYQQTNNIENFNNVAKPDVYPDLILLADDVNKYVKPTLSMVNQSRMWNYDAINVFDKLSVNMMLPSTKFVEKLLNETKINVVVYNGNMDAVCPMSGAVNWVHKLKWPGSEKFRNQSRTQMQGSMNGFYKAVDRLSLWWVLGAGHWSTIPVALLTPIERDYSVMVPEDNPAAMEQILNYMTNGGS